MSRSLLSRPGAVALAVLGIIAFQIAVLYSMGRLPICACGYVKFWHGVVKSSENSQHIFDWYTFSHVLHGFLFFFLTWLALPRMSLGVRLILAVLIECGWEIAENSEFIINRYRAATPTFGYFGDTIINSVSDVVAMSTGFFLASRLPVWVTIVLALISEVVMAFVIRDNLILNIVMLIYPLDFIRGWQAALP